MGFDCDISLGKRIGKSRSAPDVACARTEASSPSCSARSSRSRHSLEYLDTREPIEPGVNPRTIPTDPVRTNGAEIGPIGVAWVDRDSSDLIFWNPREPAIENINPLVVREGVHIATLTVVADGLVYVALDPTREPTHQQSVVELIEAVPLLLETRADDS